MKQIYRDFLGAPIDFKNPTRYNDDGKVLGAPKTNVIHK